MSKEKKLPFGAFLFTTIPGVSKSIDAAIKKNFDTLDDLCEASLGRIREIEGVGEEIAGKIKKLAMERKRDLENEIKKMGNEKIIPLKDDFNAEVEEGEEDEAQYILVEKVADKFNKPRTRFKITPSTCIECGFDVCRENKLVDYSLLDEYTKLRVDETLKSHREKHSLSEAKIVTESQLKQMDNFNQHLGI